MSISFVSVSFASHGRTAEERPITPRPISLYATFAVDVFAGIEVPVADGALTLESWVCCFRMHVAGRGSHPRKRNND